MLPKEPNKHQSLLPIDDSLASIDKRLTGSITWIKLQKHNTQLKLSNFSWYDKLVLKKKTSYSIRCAKLMRPNKTERKTQL